MADSEFQTDPMNAGSDYESSVCLEEESSVDKGPVCDYEVSAPLCSCTGMWKPWLIVPEAFVDGPERNLLQLAAALPMPVDDLWYELEGLGLDATTPSDLFKLAEHRGSACYLYHGHKLHLWDQPTQRRADRPRSIVASIFSGRLYLYADAAGFVAEDAKRHPGARVGARWSNPACC